MRKLSAQIGLGALAVLSIATALYSLRFWAALVDVWPQIDVGIRAVIGRVPVRALTHMLIAPIPLLLGPFQFITRLRTKYPRVHRRTGQIYVVTCIIAGLAALATTPFASGGPVAGLGFGILAVLWIGVTAAAWQAAVQRKFDLHRALMRFSYAMTFAAVTLRLQIPIGLALGYTSYSAMSVWLAYTSWIPNVIVVAIYSVLTSSTRVRTSRATESL